MDGDKEEDEDRDDTSVTAMQQIAAFNSLTRLLRSTTKLRRLNLSVAGLLKACLGSYILRGIDVLMKFALDNPK